MGRWLARFSFSFFIVAMILLWQIYRSQKGEAPPLPVWRQALYLAGAFVGVSLGFMGLRQRHRDL
jgi:hypothetical protein